MDFYSSLSSYLPQEEIDGLSLALARKRTYAFFINPNKIKEDFLLSLYPHIERIPLTPNGYRYDGDEYALGKSLLFDLGGIYIQDPSAMLVSAFLKPRTNAKVLDLCAAPGGKTIGLACARKDVTILANDLSYPRAKELSNNVERMGLDNVAVTSADFAQYYHQFKEYFDAIILDAPCSGSAMFRKNEAAAEDWSIAKVRRCAVAQISLLEMAYEMLSPGGRLIYSTCSFSKEEDLDPIIALVSAHSDIHTISLPSDPSFFVHPDLADAIFLFPHRYQGEGQFICLLQKDGETKPSSSKLTPCPKQYQELASKYGLENHHFKLHNDSLYAISSPLETYKLPLLRYGIKVAEGMKPDFALARAVSSKRSIALNEKQAANYLEGLSFPLIASNGYHVVSYKGLNLGFVKVSNNTAKNHYPKGLRHAYPLPLFRL